jgi:hypothetical protein
MKHIVSMYEDGTRQLTESYGKVRWSRDGKKSNTRD